MPYKLKIEEDTDLDGLSPRDWDNLGHMVCWHSRYNLGDEQRRDDVNEWLRELACSLDPSLEDRLLYWEDGDGWTRLMNKASEPIAASDNKIKDLVMAVIDKHTVMLPLYLYDHGGITKSLILLSEAAIGSLALFISRVQPSPSSQYNNRSSRDGSSEQASSRSHSFTSSRRCSSPRL
jgi:hypothetical protein